MTHYLIKHSDDDVRLHAEDGTEPLSSGWSEWPTINEIAKQCAEDGPGGSLFGQDDLRDALIDVLSGGIRKLDLRAEGVTVPWS